ncbi:unnamed protein product [Sphagnum balticum]
MSEKAKIINDARRQSVDVVNVPRPAYQRYIIKVGRISLDISLHTRTGARKVHKSAVSGARVRRAVFDLWRTCPAAAGTLFQRHECNGSVCRLVDSPHLMQTSTFPECSNRGTIFGLYAVIVLAMLFGALGERAYLPPLFGQVVAGILLRNAPFNLNFGAHIDMSTAGVLKKLAFVSLLLKAGISMDVRNALAAIVPCAGGLLWTLLKAPTEIAVGILYGCIGGTLLWVLPVDRKVRFDFVSSVSTIQSHVLRFVLLFALALLCMFGSIRISLAGAGALGTLIVPLVASIKWQQWSQTGIQNAVNINLCRPVPHAGDTRVGVSHVTDDVWIDGERSGHHQPGIATQEHSYEFTAA